MKTSLSNPVSAKPSRRDCGRLVLAAVLANFTAGSFTAALAHTPFRHWKVYRRKHLLIGCHKKDMRTYQLAGELVSVLQEHLPKASARVARAPTTRRLASLMATDQLDVAILGDQDALDMAAGINGFEPYGSIALQTLAVLPEHMLVSRPGIPDKHAWLVASSLHDAGPKLTSQREPTLPWHNGASLFHTGKDLPENNG